VALDDKFDRLSRLMTMGKEKGYVLYDEVSEMLPGDLTAGVDLDDLLSNLDSAGIEILEEPKLDAKLEETEELLDIELLDHVVIGQGRYESLKDRGQGF